MARWRSSSETGLTSGPTWPGYAGSAPSGWAMTTRGGAGGGAAGGGAGAFRTSAAKAWATISGTACGSSPFSFRLYLSAMVASMSCTTATNVSMTPSPRAAIAGNAFRPQAFRARSSSTRGMRGSRSCLLYWRTRGTFSGTRRLASRLTFMFSKAARFSRAMDFWLSATKTTASAPASTTRRVALYCTWPGTVYSWILKS